MAGAAASTGLGIWLWLRAGPCFIYCPESRASASPGGAAVLGVSPSLHRFMNQPPRVLGWDLLRGLCAAAVATYHLLIWQEVAELHSIGTYGVYLFFLLSGASLAYTYAGAWAEGSFAFNHFLWSRYLRLAPLYIALMVVVLPWKLAKEGVSSELLAMYASNVLFVFGFFNPATHAVLVGGWSLGIEAIFYLLFPLAMAIASLRTRWWTWGVFAAVLAVQLAWVHATIGWPGAVAPHWAAYHQVPAFAAYFMGGCLMGMAQRNRALAGQPAHTGQGRGPAGCDKWLIWPLLPAGFGLMLVLNPDTSGEQLVGWRGLVLCALCFGLVYASARLRLSHRWTRAAQHAGNATYGIYLLHPVVFFGLVFFFSTARHQQPGRVAAVAPAVVRSRRTRL